MNCWSFISIIRRRDDRPNTFANWLDSDPLKIAEIDTSSVKVMRKLKNMNEEKKYTVLIGYSFNGKVETLNAGVMSKEDCEYFIEETISEKEWINVKKRLSDKDEFKKFINVHNIAYMRLVRVRSADHGEYVVVEEQ